jgi:S-adenosylmethionine synthetase
VLCPFNGAFRQPVANDRPTRYIITRGRPIDEYRGKNIVSPSIWLLVGTMVHTRTGNRIFAKKKLKKIKKFYRKKLKKFKKNLKKI